MAEIQHIYAEVLETDANSTTWIDSAIIVAGSFTANKKYLILGHGFVQSQSSSVNEVRYRLVHGTTPTEFTHAFMAEEQNAGVQKTDYGYMTVFTQPATTELVKLQISTSSTNTARSHLNQIFAMNLSDDLIENTDWFFNEDADGQTITTAFVAGASVTFTANGTDDWLIIAQGSVDVVTIIDEIGMSIHDSVSDLDEPRIDVEGEDATNDFTVRLLARTFTPSSGSHIYSVRFINEGGSNVVQSSRIFALNLSKFNQRSYSYDAAEVQPAASPTWTTTRTLSPTPSITGDWFILGNFTNDVAATTNDLAMRMQINASGAGLASTPNYGDDAPQADSWDNLDVCPVHMFAMISLSSGAARDINLDVQMITGTTLRVQERHLVAFSMELTALGPTVTPLSPLIINQAIHRSGSW